VGVCANFTSARRGELVEYLRPYRPSDIDGHPWKDWALDDEGGQRPSGRFEPLEPRQGSRLGTASSGAGGRGRLCHMQRTRFRHTPQFRRWRLDKKPQERTFNQLDSSRPTS
jgi:hypothetical protein